MQEPVHTCRESWERTATRAILRCDRETLSRVLVDAWEHVADMVASGDHADRHEAEASARNELVGVVERLCLDAMVTDMIEAVGEPAYDAVCAWATEVAEECGEAVADAVCEYIGDSRAYSMSPSAYYGVCDGDFL